ncbi:MAG: carboxylating nicotinate-nucleotide diphosphorylase [Nitrospiraceae bacterium]|nr:MAG: carboxylating nicotinate-nucleotide diphosphorylase [Nitrospiraceae bacterium]
MISENSAFGKHICDTGEFNSIDRILLNSLHEDIGNGDVTTSALIPANHISRAVIVAKGDFILAGLPFAERSFRLLDDKIKSTILKKEGGKIKSGDIIARITGHTAGLLMAERVALNILQRLSGIATLTDDYVQKVRGLRVKITDTRKTAPGLRLLDKYAVRTGGGHNHRYGLFDGVLIKDNHIAAAGGVGKAVKIARSHAHHLMKIEVEVKNIPEVKEALSAGADVIMLDNMSIDVMKKAVNIIRGKNSGVIIEASGNVTLENVRSIAETGVDLVSVGALTHSAPAADISLKIVF